MTPESTVTGNYILSLYHAILYQDRITYNCPVNESNEIECTLDHKPTLSGEYILSKMIEESSTNHITLSDLVYVKFDLSPLSTEKQQIPVQEIKGFNTELIIAVSDEITNENCPILYYNSNDITKTLTYCTVLSGLAYYPVNDIPNGEYTIYYKTPCKDSVSSSADLTSTGITLKVNVEVVNTVTSITFLDDSRCIKEVNSGIKITTELMSTGFIKDVIIKKKEDHSLYIYQTCKYTLNEITCTNLSSSLKGGEYQIFAINGNNRYDFSSPDLVLKVSKLGMQLLSQQYYRDSDIPSFEIILASNGEQKPSIFLDEEGNTEVPCEKENNKLKCSPNSGTMVGNQVIYYRDICGNIISTGITIKTLDSSATVHFITQIASKKDLSASCNDNKGQFYVYLVFSATAPIIESITLRHKEIDAELIFNNCATDADDDALVRCTYSTGITYDGYYLLSSVTKSSDEEMYFDLISMMTSNEMEVTLYKGIAFYPTQPIVNKFNPFYYLEFKSEKDAELTIIKDFNGNVLDCRHYKKYKMCYTKTGLRYIYGKCGTQVARLNMYNSQVSDSRVLFNVLSFTNENNEPYCVEDTKDTTLVLTIDGTTSYTQDNSTTFYCNLGGTNGYSSISTDENNTISVGDHFTFSISTTSDITNYFLGGSCYTPVTVVPQSLITMKVVSSDPIINADQNSTQTLYDFEGKLFIVNLANENVDAPSIYISKDNSEYTKINCTKIEDKLQCTPLTNQMEIQTEYEVFYANRCDKLLTSNIKVTFEKQKEYFGSQRINEYYVNQGHNIFKVVLQSEASTIPELYINIDNTYTKIEECVRENNFLICTLTDSFLQSVPNGEYQIWDSYSQTQLTLKRLDNAETIYTATSIDISSGDDVLCTTAELKEIIITLDPDISTLSSFSGALTTISSDNVEATFDTCELVTGESKIKCTSTDSIPVGTYYLIRITGDLSIDVFEISYTEFKREKVITPYDSSQQSPKPIAVGTNFEFYGDPLALKLYIDNDISKEVQLYEAYPGYGKYTATSKLFPVSGIYSFYYKDKCNRLQDTNLEGQVVYTVTFNKLYFTGTEKCSSNAFSSFEIKGVGEPTVAGAVAVLKLGDNEYSFVCDAVTIPTTCTSETPVSEEGTFTLTSFTGADGFDLDTLSDKTLILELIPFAPSEEQPTGQTISQQNKEITIKLASTSTTAPSKLYVDVNGTEKKLTCQKASEEADEVNLKCTANYNDYPDEGPYTIYHKNPCGKKIDSQVSFTKVLPKNLAVTSFVTTGTNTCEETAFTSFTVSFNDTLQGAITGVKIKKDAEEEKEIACSGESGDSSITCAISDVTEGKYVLTGIVGDDNFEVPADTAISYETDPLANVEQNTTQTINNKKTKFSIKLKSESTAVPTFKIGENGVSIAKCEQLTEEGKKDIVECEPSDSEMDTTKDYTIFYVSACGKEQSTGIIVHHVVNSDIQVNSITINEGITATCTGSPISSFSLTLDKQTTGPITEVRIKTGTTEIPCTCGEEFEKSSYDCSPKDSSAIIEGEYTLTSVTGDDTFRIGSGVSKIQYEKQYLVPAEGQTQKIDKNTKTFTLTLAEGITKDPAIYVKDSTTAISCTRNPPGSTTLECTPNDTVMPDTANYEIEYMGACNTKQPTGVTIEHVLTSTISVGQLYLSSKDITCDSEPISSFTFTIGSAPKGAIEYAELTKQSDNTVHKFSSCIANNEALTVTCSGYDGTIPDGDYKLTKVEGIDTYILTSIASTKITYDIDPLLEGSEPKPSIDKNNKSFFVNWNLTDTPTPKIFINTSNPPLKCVKYEEAENVIECKPTDEDMPDTDNYELKYTGACYKYRPLGITVWHQLTTDITASSFSLDSEKSTMCSISPITSFSFSIDKVPNGAITDATLTKDDNEGTTVKFNKCEANEKVVTCSEPEKEITGGNYTLTHVEGVDTYILTNVVDSVQYDDYKGPFGAQLEEQQEINGDVDHFVLILSSSEELTTLPTVKVKVEEEYKDIRCEQDEEDKSHLNCYPDLNNMPETELYEIYYIGACKEPISTEISIKNVFPIEITVTDVYLSETGKCLPEVFSTFYFVTDQKPTASLQYAILKREEDEEGTEFKFNSCNAGEKVDTNEEGETTTTYYVICTSLEEGLEIVPGDYVLTEVKGKDTYSIDVAVKATYLQYQTNPVIEQILLEQRVNPDTPSFYITLASETTKQPRVFFRGEEQNTEITCEKNQTDLTQLICTPDQSTEMTETKDYEIVYEAECGVIKATNITVHNVLPISIEVTDVVLAENFVCRTDLISEVKFTIDIEPTGSVKYVELADSEGNKTKLEKCEAQQTVIVCTTETPIDVEGMYKVTELKGVDTYIIDNIADKELQLLTSKQYLGEQPNEEYTVDNDTNYFDIVLSDAETEAPTIYAGEDESLIIDCVKNAEILVCTPNKDNMPESQLYEIYYKDGCGNIASTGIKVNNVLPEEGDGEIIIETKGGYLTMWKLFITGLLVMMF